MEKELKRLFKTIFIPPITTLIQEFRPKKPTGPKNPQAQKTY